MRFVTFIGFLYSFRLYIVCLLLPFHCFKVSRNRIGTFIGGHFLSLYPRVISYCWIYIFIYFLDSFTPFYLLDSFTSYQLLDPFTPFIYRISLLLSNFLFLIILTPFAFILYVYYCLSIVLKCLDIELETLLYEATSFLSLHPLVYPLLLDSSFLHFSRFKLSGQ